MSFKTFPLAFSADAHYGPALGVALSSLLATQAKESPPFEFYILDGGILERDKQKIEALLAQEAKGHQMTWFPMGGEYEGLPLSEHFTSAAYYRFALQRLLPESLEWILYMDVDVVVLRDLAPLYEEIEKQKTLCQEREARGEDKSELPLLGAMEDPFTLLAPEEYKKRVYGEEGLGLLPEEAYFISSPLLMNLKKMREQSLEEKLLSNAQAYAQKICYVDQDVYNITCPRDRFLLSFAYGYIPMLDQFSFLEVKQAGSGLREEEFKEAQENPYVIHYAGRKPGLPLSILPSYVRKQTREREFFSAWQASPWKNQWIYERYFFQRMKVALSRRKGWSWLVLPVTWGMRISWKFGRFFWVTAMKRAIFSSKRDS